MFDPFSLALMGAAAGALFNKKNPIKGAALGAGIGYTGGLLNPAVGGAAEAGSAATGSAAAGTAGASSAGGLLSTQAPAPVVDAAITPVANPITGSNPGLLEYGKSALSQAQPFLQAAGTGMQVAQAMRPPQQTPMGPSPINPPMPNNNLGAMVSGMQQQQLQQMQQEQQARAMRRQIMGY